METKHRFFNIDSRDIDNIDVDDVNLVVTSPPYPMIDMWDDVFSEMNEDIESSLESKDGWESFELMHKELDKIWDNIDELLTDSGVVCINIGDATRKIGSNFNIYPNHARIIEKFKSLGYDVLPSILWRKPTNKASKFMGSGMLPGNAYVTLEHEHILIFRKNGTRRFNKDRKEQRYNSAYFWEERNKWFSDLWEDVKGESQVTTNESRDVAASYPLEIPFRLIQMYSIQGDTVLDPFLGTGTTSIAAAASARNSIGLDIDNEFIQSSIERFENIRRISKEINNNRIEKHKEFLENNSHNYDAEYYDFGVITKQEKQIKLLDINTVNKNNNTINIQHKFN